jgi:hypothetical protein
LLITNQLKQHKTKPQLQQDFGIPNRGVHQNPDETVQPRAAVNRSWLVGGHASPSHPRKDKKQHRRLAFERLCDKLGKPRSIRWHHVHIGHH